MASCEIYIASFAINCLRIGVSYDEFVKIVGCRYLDQEDRDMAMYQRGVANGFLASEQIRDPNITFDDVFRLPIESEEIVFKKAIEYYRENNYK